MKKGVKILLWVVGIVLALLIVVSLLAGPIAKGYINGHGEELTGCKVHVDRVGLNLITGNVNVRGLDVYEDDAETVFAGFDTLDVNVRLLKIPFHTLHFGHITLAGLHAAVEQDGDRFNFSSLLEHFASEDTVTDTTPSDWTLKFYNIRISHARLDYDDVATRKGVHLPDVNLRVPGFVLGGKGESEGGLNIAFDRGGHLGMDANYDASTNTFAMTVDIDDFSVDNLDTYLADILTYDHIAGTVDAHLKAEGNVDHIMQTTVSGNVAVNGLDLADKHAQIAGFDSLVVAVSNINLDENIFDISSVRLTGLKVLYEQWQGYSNIDRLTTVEEPQPVTLGTQAPVADTVAKTDTVAATSSKPMQLRIGSVVVADAAVTYADNTLPDPFRFPITKLNIKASDVTTTGENSATVDAVMPGGGRFNVIWHGDIGNWKQHQDLFLTIRGLDMKQLSPWTVAYTGQPIEDGMLSLTSHNIIAASRLVGKNTIDIYKARVGERRQDVNPEMKLPLKAALYVLRDKDDKILIDLPVNGNVDSPEFSYMKIVWKTLGNLLVKVATSPARALGNALGIGDDDLDFLAVDALHPAFTSENYHTLSSLATIARSDSLVSFVFERRFNDLADSATVVALDGQLRSYLLEQGLADSRFSIVAGETVTDAKQPTGYAITSEIKIEE